MLLMQAAELYEQVTTPLSRGMSDLYSKPRPSRDEEKAGEVHAEIVRRLNLSASARESVLIGLCDLDQAMKRMAVGTRLGIASYVQSGPRSITADDVEFKYGQTKHVMAVWREMNGIAPDAQRANRRLGITALEAK